MVNFTLFENISDLPLVSDSDRAAIGLENWLSASRDHGLTAAAKALADDAVGQSFLRAIFGNSPFLSHGVLRDPGFMLRLAEDGPAPCFDMVLDGLDGGLGALHALEPALGAVSESGERALRFGVLL